MFHIFDRFMGIYLVSQNKFIVPYVTIYNDFFPLSFRCCFNLNVYVQVVSNILQRVTSPGLLAQ